MTAAAGSHSRLIWMLRQAFQAVEAEKGARLQPIGVRAAHYSLMINLAEAPGLSGAALARRLSVAPQNVASLVGRLEREGLIERRSHHRHGHVQELYLTSDGEQLISVADAAVGAFEDDLGQLLGDEDAATLKRILMRLVNGLGAPPQAASSPEATSMQP